MKKKPKERYLAVIDNNWNDELERAAKDSLKEVHEELQDYAEDPDDFQLFTEGSEAIIYKLVPIARVTPAHTIAIQSINL